MLTHGPLITRVVSARTHFTDIEADSWPQVLPPVSCLVVSLDTEKGPETPQGAPSAVRVDKVPREEGRGQGLSSKFRGLNLGLFPDTDHAMK